MNCKDQLAALRKELEREQKKHDIHHQHSRIDALPWHDVDPKDAPPMGGLPPKESK